MIGEAERRADVRFPPSIGRSLNDAAGREAVLQTSWRTAAKSDFCSLREQQGILYVDAKITDRVLDLGMTQKNLDCPQIPRRLVDHRGFRPA